MHPTGHPRNSRFGMSWNPASATLAIMFTLLFLIFLILFLTLTAQPAQGQTFQVLYSFTNGPDGGIPYAPLTLDRAGNLYGTTSAGGQYDLGTVFRLTHSETGWALTTLSDFADDGGGFGPQSKVLIDANGSVYSATEKGGLGPNCGVVFKLAPSPSACLTTSCRWTKTLLYQFTGDTDGCLLNGDLAFDNARNLYGTTQDGGTVSACYGWLGTGCGTVFQLTPSSPEWTKQILYSFTGGTDGDRPGSGLVLDSAGNLYGTTEDGGDLECDYGGSCGTVFEVTPSGAESVLHAFQGGSDGANPRATLILSGALYGTTRGMYPYADGTVFMLSGGSDTVLMSFGDWLGGPYAGVVMDRAGNLYGALADGGSGCGSAGCGYIFKLTNSGGRWTASTLYSFTGGNDGIGPNGVILDAAGNIYGTAGGGGAYGYGTVWEITP